MARCDRQTGAWRGLQAVLLLPSETERGDNTLTVNYISLFLPHVNGGTRPLTPWYIGFSLCPVPTLPHPTLTLSTSISPFFLFPFPHFLQHLYSLDLLNARVLLTKFSPPHPVRTFSHTTYKECFSLSFEVNNEQTKLPRKAVSFGTIRLLVTCSSTFIFYLYCQH